MDNSLKLISDSSKSSRVIGVDLVKVIASLFVVMVHHFSTMGFYNIKYNNGFLMKGSTAIYLITLTSVPLFLISTGYLLGNRKPDRKHFSGIIYFLLEFILITVIGVLISSIYFETFSMSHWLNYSLKRILAPSYYIGLYFSLYLLAPFLNSLFNSLTKKNDKILLLVIVIFVVSLPSLLNRIPNVNFFDVRPTAVWAYMYYLIGLSIRYFRPKISKAINLLLIITVAILYGLVLNITNIGTVYSHYFGYYEGIFIVLMAVLIFLFFYNINFKSKILRMVAIFLGSSSLTFYLFSMLFSDRVANSLVPISGNLLYDILFTLIPVAIVSLSLSVPLALIIRYLMKKLAEVSL